MTIFELNLFWIQIAPTYYGLMYAIWFIAGFLIIKKRWKIRFSKDKNQKVLDDLVFFIFLWVVLWWRLWYVLFYDFFYYLENPLSILKVWEWWMSFHWWVIWVILAMWYFSKKYKFPFLVLADEITAILPIWLWLGRIWNYLNNELYGYAWYNWVFSMNIDWVGHFPSPILEFLLEWVLLFIILNYFYTKRKSSFDEKSNKKNGKKYRYNWQVAVLFLIFYSVFRIIVEMFFRIPDPNIWYIFWFLTMWEILSIPMFLLWVYYYFRLNLTNLNKD